MFKLTPEQLAKWKDEIKNYRIKYTLDYIIAICRQPQIRLEDYIGLEDNDEWIAPTIGDWLKYYQGLNYIIDDDLLYAKAMIEKVLTRLKELSSQFDNECRMIDLPEIYLNELNSYVGKYDREYYNVLAQYDDFYA